MPEACFPCEDDDGRNNIVLREVTGPFNRAVGEAYLAPIRGILGGRQATA
jgi:hypothetical protein